MSVVITGLGVLAGSLVGFTLGCLWVALHDDAALGVVEDATVAVDAAFAAMASAQAEVARVERQSAIRAAVVTETHELLWQQAQMIESLEDRLLRALNERDELMRAATRIVPGTRVFCELAVDPTPGRGAGAGDGRGGPAVGVVDGPG